MSRSNILHNLKYCQYYCEENIWQLCQQSKYFDKAWVLFISNADNQFAIWNQRIAELGEPVIWDYHVILLAKVKDEFRIFDFDSKLEFGCAAELYFEQSFPSFDIPETFHPLFLIQSSAHYLANFRTNREHMKGSDGKFLQAEPDWEKLSERSNLDEYLNMDSKRDYILSLEKMRSHPWNEIEEHCHP